MSAGGALREEGSIKTILREDLREPQKALVILLNDDYTTMKFVIDILMEVFHKNLEEAERITLLVHERGRGECGIYPVEIAETKVSLVAARAMTAGFPLRCSMELI
jgi:ATP-dependent Clp protease adaptor protein ClpS